MRLLHDIEGRDRTYFQVTVVLLTAQIHQGIRLSPLKVLVSLVFRPASNLLLRLLRICNNAMFALLHSKRHVRSERERLNKGKSDASIVRIMGKGGKASERGERERKGAESNYELFPRRYIERTEVAGAVFGAEQLVAFQLKEMFTTKARYLLN